jgi:hypothetical protein
MVKIFFWSQILLHFMCFLTCLSTLLASSDADVVIASLQTLAAFVKKPVGKCSIRDTSLNAKLFSLSQGWGGKEEGLGLLACSTENGTDPVAYQLGSALHFEFYANESVQKGDSEVELSRDSGLQVIHIPDLSMNSESDLQLLKHLVDEYKVPVGLRFSLLTRLRFARAFSHLDTRQQYICIRLLAFTVLVQASNDTNDLAAFFTNEPEFVNELVTLVRFDDVVPEDIRILAILALGALYQDRLIFLEFYFHFIFSCGPTSLPGNSISTLLFSCGSTSLLGCSSTIQWSSFDFLNLLLL